MTADFYYTFRHLIPRWIQIKVRRQVAKALAGQSRHCWPISEAAGVPPLL